MLTVKLLEAGRLDYPRALALMQGLAGGVRSGKGPPCLIICSHEPVITLGKRAREGDLLATLEELSAQGIEVVRVERGGLATYHGPGQIMAYPVLRLVDLGLGVEAMVSALEKAVIQTLADLGLAAGQDPEHRGVWVGEKKIASIGLRVKQGVCTHGLALNLGQDLGGFALINPCGLGPGRMTSLARELGKEPDPVEVGRSLADNLARCLGISLVPWTLDQAARAAGASA